MKFDFNLFSSEKQKTFARLNRGESFSETTINFQDIKIDKETKKEGELINQSTIII